MHGGMSGRQQNALRCLEAAGLCAAHAVQGQQRQGLRQGTEACCVPEHLHAQGTLHLPPTPAGSSGPATAGAIEQGP
jgi:hypothetical protein